MRQPKDYPMGKTDQLVYFIRAVCILAIIAVFILALTEAFLSAALETTKVLP